MLSFKTLVIILSIISTLSDHLKCSKGEVDYYSFFTRITAVGGSQEEMRVNCVIGLSCTGVFKKEGMDLLLNVIEVSNVKIMRRGKLAVEKQYAHSFDKPITFTQTRDGRVIDIITNKDEIPHILSLKKSIVEQFQISLHNQEREETSQIGSVIYKYDRRLTTEGRDIIKKTSVTVLENSDKRLKRRDLKYDMTTLIQVNKDGKIHDIATKESSKCGKSSERRHQMYEKSIKDVGQEDTPKGFSKNKDAKNAFNFESETTIQFIKSGIYSSKSDEVTFKVESDEGSVLDVGHVLNLQDIHIVSKLGVDDSLIEEVTRYGSEQLDKETNLLSLLSEIRKNPKDQNLLSKANFYIQHFYEKSLPIITEQYNNLSLDDKDDLDYAISLLSMFAASQSEKGQIELVKTMSHPATVQQAIINTMDLNNPNERVVDRLKTLSIVNSFKGIHQEDLDIIKANAYFAYAHTASKISNKQGSIILEQITDNLGNSKNIDEYETHVHALGNAGKIVPLEALKIIAIQDAFPLQIRQAAIQSLGKRTELENHAKVTSILHNLTEDNNHELIRVNAVKALTEREMEIQDGASVLHLLKFLEDSKTPDALVHSIKDYYLEEASDLSHQILHNTKLGINNHVGNREDAIKLMNNEGYSDTKTLWNPFKWIKKKINKGKKAVGHITKKIKNKVVGSIRKSINHIVGGIKDIVKVTIATIKGGIELAKDLPNILKRIRNFEGDIKKTFSKAEFRGQKMCVSSNRNGENICMFDQDMISFVRKQGDLTKMKSSKYFQYEKLIGVEIMHVYIGAVGYVGTAVDCDTSTLDLVIFGRGEARVNVFNNKLPIVVAELELQSRSGQRLRDKLYLKIFKAVLFNGPVITPKLKNSNSCQKVTKILIRPVRKILKTFAWTVLVVKIPLVFSISIVGEMGVDLGSVVCIERLTLTASIEPFVGLGISAKAGIGFGPVSGGVKADFDSNYKLVPGIGTSDCNLCVFLNHEIRPIRIRVGFYAQILPKSLDFNIFDWDGPVIKKQLFKKCVSDQRGFDPDSIVSEAARGLPFRKSMIRKPVKTEKLPSVEKQNLKQRQINLQKPKQPKPKKPLKVYSKKKSVTKKPTKIHTNETKPKKLANEPKPKKLAHEPKPKKLAHEPKPKKVVETQTLKIQKMAKTKPHKGKKVSQTNPMNKNKKKSENKKINHITGTSKNNERKPSSKVSKKQTIRDKKSKSDEEGSILREKRTLQREESSKWSEERSKFREQESKRREKETEERNLRTIQSQTKQLTRDYPKNLPEYQSNPGQYQDQQYQSQYESNPGQYQDQQYQPQYESNPGQYQYHSNRDQQYQPQSYSTEYPENHPLYDNPIQSNTISQSESTQIPMRITQYKIPLVQIPIQMSQSIQMRNSDDRIQIINRESRRRAERENNQVRRNENRLRSAMTNEKFTRTVRDTERRSRKTQRNSTRDILKALSSRPSRRSSFPIPQEQSMDYLRNLSRRSRDLSRKIEHRDLKIKKFQRQRDLSRRSEERMEKLIK